MPKHLKRPAVPMAEWTLQQLRESVTGEEPYKFIIQDRDSIYFKDLDASITSLGMKVMKTPYKTPQANSFCERLIGTVRRECLDFIIPLHEAHIHRILKEWTVHYNRGRPQLRLGPGIPEFASTKPEFRIKRHNIPDNHHVVAIPILGGLHHEYRLEKIAA
jgi:hypothetical protein